MNSSASKTDSLVHHKGVVLSSAALIRDLCGFVSAFDPVAGDFRFLHTGDPYSFWGFPVSWFLSDDVPEIPSDILARLDARYDPGDVADACDIERNRSSLRRVVAINQQLTWRIVQLQNELHTANTNMGYLKIQVQDLVKRLHRMGYEPSHKPPGR